MKDNKTIIVLIVLAVFVMFVYTNISASRLDRQRGKFIVDHRCSREDHIDVINGMYRCDVGVLSSDDIDLMVKAK